MAIAFDASTDGGTATATSFTWSHTNTGSNLILFVGLLSQADPGLITGITYAAAAMDAVNEIVPQANETIYLFLKMAPASGANNVVASASSSVTMYGDSTSYTGAAQTDQPDAQFAETEVTATKTTSVTTIADNCWLTGFARNGAMAAGTATTMRAGINNTVGAMDSNGAKSPAGSYSLQTTQTSASTGHCIASFAPAAAATAIKTVNGLAVASVKTVEGLAIASVKTFNGLA